ncbi:MAG: hydantoinase/oxoprolinase family protein [Candidatus Aminicenantes bacterium]|nr:hydantoinase/oxoprolinase family protein [Candidatus Aminicenantes bacterium]
MKKEVRVGIDTGGTFTDFVFCFAGKTVIKKIPSTPEKPSAAIIKGLEEFLNNADYQPVVIHGTTVGTNALLERKGGKIALLTTCGFEDVLFIGRQTRRNLYSLRGETRHPLLPRKLCFGLEERTTPQGNIEYKVTQKDMETVVLSLKKNKIDAAAVCFIHSYANPSNERTAGRELRKHKILTSLSTDILSEYREYERTAAAAVNAYLMPVLNKYLSGLQKELKSATLYIMQSNEGYISAARAGQEPIRTALSGPAGGVVGSFQLAKASGFNRIITFDMGGTSCDVSLVDGRINRTQESTIGDFPIRLPIIDIHTVGAGGGSIARIDQGGSLRVGPESAGADPGPACYGKDLLPTVTDAHLFLGRLDHRFFLGGNMKLHPDRSRKSLEKLAAEIGKSTSETAEGIIEIANANMEKAIRVISVEKGHDPRSFSLFSFGGAGGLHAADIAAHLRISSVLVPKNAGVLSAFGLLQADSVKDYSLSLLQTAEDNVRKELQKHFEKLTQKALEDMKRENFQESRINLFSFLDLRYQGQSYEITVPYKFSKDGRSRFINDFHQAHKKLYSYWHPEKSVEIVNIRVKAVGQGKKIRLKKHLFQQTSPAGAFIRNQEAVYGGEPFKIPIYDRSYLGPGNKLKGPAVIGDYESTTFLPPGFKLEVDGYLNLIIDK